MLNLCFIGRIKAAVRDILLSKYVSNSLWPKVKLLL